VKIACVTLSLSMLAVFSLSATAANTPSNFDFVGVGGIVIGAVQENCTEDAAVEGLASMFAATPGDAADTVCKGARGHFVSLYVSETGAQGKVDEIDIYDPSDQDAALAWNADDNAFADVVTNVSDVCPGSKYAVAAGPAPLAGSGDTFLCVARFGAVIEPNQDGADQTAGAVGIFVYDGSHLNRFWNKLNSVIFPSNALGSDDLESDDPAMWNQVNTVWKKGRSRRD
jgi:hypothetical protein